MAMGRMVSWNGRGYNWTTIFKGPFLNCWAQEPLGRSLSAMQKVLTKEKYK